MHIICWKLFGEVDKGYLMIMMGVSGYMFLLVPAHPGSPGQRAIVVYV